MHQTLLSICTGHRLSGHAIHELNALNLLECSFYCLRKQSECKSINYKETEDQDFSVNCQLINATKTTHPKKLLPDANYDNYEPIMEMVFLCSLYNFFYKFMDYWLTLINNYSPKPRSIFPPNHRA